jgi:pteridine reductase
MGQESLAGMTALVTGAAVRIGRAISLALAREGANVVLHCRRSAEEAAGLAEEIRGLGVQAWVLTADFSKREEYETLLDRAVEAAGDVHLLVNSASMFPANTVDSITLDDLSLALLVNAWVPFYLGRALVRLGGKRKIVNLIDTRITSDDPGHTAYILSKHLLYSLTRTCALAFAPDVTVNAIGPGLILPPPGQPESYLDSLVHTVPLKRHGDGSDVAEAAVYLLKSTFITGAIIFVDGGRHMREYRGSGIGDRGSGTAVESGE